MASCATSTRITGSWKNPKETPKNYKSVLVIALTGNVVAKSTLENDLADVLSKNGMMVTKGMEVMPPSFTKDKPNKEAIMSKVKTNGAEGILTVSIIKEETESRYVPGTYGYEPFPRYSYYGDFWGYYDYWYPYSYTPGYYTEDKIYYLETNFYDASTEALLWSAQSETYNAESLANVSREFAELIETKLKQDKILL